MQIIRYLTDRSAIFKPARLTTSKGGLDAEMQLVKVYPDIEYQTILGFGAAITEASGYVFSHMSNEQKIEFALDCFGPGGNNYNLARIPIQSCDFSLKSHAYTDAVPTSISDLDETFSLGRDLDYIVPLAKVAVAANPNLTFLASPWSPPAWMKTNGSMSFGGKLKPEYRDMWAHMIVRTILEYRHLGISVTRLTVQNEPCASQIWESCLFDALEEAEFIANHLKPALASAGLDSIKILAWDHNKERLIERIRAFSNHQDWIDAIGGFAFHWYSGDHFNALAEARRFLKRDFELVFSEGCDAYSAGNQKDELDHAEHYAHEIIGDIENGANAFIDWNALLDSLGGPNHVGNFCDAPMMYDEKAGKMRTRLPFHYIGHFSRFILPQSRHVLSSCYTEDLESTACVRPDGTCAVVLLNRTEKKIEFSLVFGGNDEMVGKLSAPPHSIQTILTA